MKIKELFSTPGTFCKMAQARNSLGTAVHPESPEAVQWDLAGAVHKCYPVDERAAIFGLIHLEVRGRDIPTLCDAPDVFQHNMLTLVTKLDI